MSMPSHLLERGISFWKNGQKKQARKIFEAIIYNDRQNDIAWIWYVYSLDTNKEKIAALENFLNIFPNHSVGKKALAKLKADGTQQDVIASNTGEKAQKNNRSYQESSIPIGGVQPTQQSIFNSIPWLFVVLGLCLLLFSSTIFISRFNSLRSKYQTLEAKEALISKNYEQLNRDYRTVISEKEALGNTYNALVSQYNTLNYEYSILTGNYDALYAEHTQLIEQYNSLAGDYSQLDNISVKPPYIVVHDRMVDTTFYDTDGQLITWTTPFSGLEYGIENGSYLRRRIVDEDWKTVLVYTEYNQPLWVRDFSDFVNPSTFRNVVPPLYAKSSSSYEFIYRIWYMIGQLANYGSEDLETPRYSLETLLAGGGDCEDLSILFASLIKAAPVDWYVDLVYVDSDNINNPQTPDHVVVYINTGQETFIVETTNDQNMLPYNNGITGWLAESLQSTDENIYPVYLR